MLSYLTTSMKKKKEKEEEERGGGGEDGRGRRGRRRSREGRKTLLRCTSLSGPAGKIQLSTAPLAGREPASLH